MSFRLMWGTLLCMLGTIASAQQSSVDSSIVAEAEQRLAQPGVSRLPLVAQELYLREVQPSFKPLSVRDAFGVVWDAEVKRAIARGGKPLRPVVYYQSCKFCSHHYQDGQLIMAFEYGGLSLAVALSELDKYYQAFVLASVAPGSNLQVDILPRQIQMAGVQPKVSLFESAYTKSVAKAMEKGARWKAALIAGLGGMATTTSTANSQGVATGMEDGTITGPYGSATYQGSSTGFYSGTTTVTTPDHRARAASQAQARQILSQAQARSSAIWDTALRATTLSAGQTASGCVYFQKPKGFKTAVLQVIVGRVSFEFPMALEN